MIPAGEAYGNCGMWDGERRIEKLPVLHLDSGEYRIRLVPEKCIDRK